jgi:hypothetical protein
MDRFELSIGNVIGISLTAFLGIPAVLLTCKYLARTNIPVVRDVANGAVIIWRVAS